MDSTTAAEEAVANTHTSYDDKDNDDDSYIDVPDSDSYRDDRRDLYDYDNDNTYTSKSSSSGTKSISTFSLLPSKKEDFKLNVSIGLKLRPLSQLEILQKAQIRAYVDEGIGRVTFYDPKSYQNKSYTVPHAFAPAAGNEEMFEYYWADILTTLENGEDCT